MLNNLFEKKLSVRQVSVAVIVIAIIFGLNWIGHHLFVSIETKTADTYAYNAFVSPLDESGEWIGGMSKDAYWEHESWRYSYTLGYKSSVDEWVILADVEIRYFDPEYYGEDTSNIEINSQFNLLDDDLYYYLPGNNFDS